MNPFNTPPGERHVLIFLLTSVALLSAPHAFNVPPLLFLFFSAMLGWRFLAVWHKGLLPGRILLLICTVAGVLLLVSQSRGILGRDGGTNLFMVALGLKLLELNNQRDMYLVVFLAFFIAATQFLFNQEIFMAVYIFAVTTLLLTVLVSINAPSARIVQNIKTALLLTAQALPVMVILFIFFPRLEAPRWLLFDEQTTATTGLSDSMEPGAISRLGLSPAIAFRVSFEGKIPAPNERYWRGPVFSRTDGRRWTQSGSVKQEKLTRRPQYSGEGYTYTLTQEPQDKNWVFALDLPASIPDDLYMTAEYRLLAKKMLDQRAAFRIRSHTRYRTGALGPGEKRRNLQLPRPPSAELNALAKSLTRPGAERTVQSVFAYFRDNPFVYTLTPQPLPENPIETFLLETRRGFCEHYATAFVYLMRMAGIPARVVTGYQGGEYNPVGKFLEIRQANAHAWAEVWLPEKGWTRVDPTAAIAPERVEQDVNVSLQIATGEANFRTVDMGGMANLIRQARFAWNSVDYAWQRWVLHYTSANQAQLFSRLGIEGVRQVALWMAFALALAVGFTALLLFRRKKHRAEKVVKLYARFCSKLKHCGLEKRPQEGALDFARRAAAEKPARAEAIRRITALYLKIRYGRQHNGNDLTELARRVKAFQS